MPHLASTTVQVVNLTTCLAARTTEMVRLWSVSECTDARVRSRRLDDLLPAKQLEMRLRDIDVVGIMLATGSGGDVMPLPTAQRSR
jgi:hypothetical protein